MRVNVPLMCIVIIFVSFYLYIPNEKKKFQAIIDVSGKYKESFRLSKNLKTSLVYPRKDSNVVSVGDHVHL